MLVMLVDVHVTATTRHDFHVSIATARSFEKPCATRITTAQAIKQAHGRTCLHLWLPDACCDVNAARIANNYMQKMAPYIYA